MRRRFLLVFNPIAGVAGSRLIDRVVAALEATGAQIVRAGPGASGPDLSELDRSPFDAVIAAGGDGTFRAIAGAIGTRLPIGILPMGTGNVLACEIGLPRRSPRKLAEVLSTGPVVEIEGARANGEPFFLMAGAGFDGDVIARLDTRLKQRVGKAAYVRPVLGALRVAQAPLAVEIDGEHHEAGWVVAANCRSYGGSFLLAHGASIVEPGLVAVLFKSSSRLVRVRQLLALGAGQLRRDPSVEMIPMRRLRLDCSVPRAVEIDGDFFAPTPLDIAAGGPKARLIVPKGFTR